MSGLAEKLERSWQRRNHLWSTSANSRTTAFRWIHGAADDLDGLAVDVYADWLVAHVYKTSMEAILEQLFAFAAPKFRGLYVKRRPKEAYRLGDTRVAWLAPCQPILGDVAPVPLLVYENDLPFEVHLGDGLSTGIFLDQRDNRALVAQQVRDKTVLNLFAYTCAFGVAAVHGQAKKVVNVDISKQALAWGRRNIERLAGATEVSYAASDVWAMLKSYARKDQVFDYVILDPPSYSTTKAQRFAARKDYASLSALAMRVVAPRGTLLACCNLSDPNEVGLEPQLTQAAQTAGRKLMDFHVKKAPLDFAALPQSAVKKGLTRTRLSHLQSVELRLE